MRTLLKVIGVLVICSIVAVVVLAVSGVYLAKKIHVVENGSDDHKNVSIDTPFGHFAVHANDKLNPEAIGIPIYPGATRQHNSGGADFTIDAGDFHKDMTVQGATYLTDDSTDQVRAFYKEKFPDWSLKSEDHGIELEMKDGSNIRTVSIRREGGHTRIGVASIGPPAAN